MKEQPSVVQSDYFLPFKPPLGLIEEEKEEHKDLYKKCLDMRLFLKEMRAGSVEKIIHNQAYLMDIQYNSMEAYRIAVCMRIKVLGKEIELFKENKVTKKF